MVGAVCFGYSNDKAIDTRSVLGKCRLTKTDAPPMLARKKGLDVGLYTSQRVYDGVRYMDSVGAVRHKRRLRKALAAMVAKQKGKQELAAS